ncbi:class I mannose-6-phosphate isomerase [Bosea sp. 685]|uniref:class I mannose-6-phosphate isomerase n=1 Tax=Bosea sp. 685 TaxID=3080057 RepID=UPI002893759D|nr:class I mannose-6-phosphate isomerase [Bosea sp. 685]WNJ93522.1 class I mannose-6-phosphate isomerase [Bosea sp. 685]
MRRRPTDAQHQETRMTIEKALRLDIEKPWGCIDRGRWAGHSTAHDMIGETWFQRPNAVDVEPELLVKLLYTSQRLSIQVHPDDASARAMGLRNGKTEAWYVLAAAPGAEVAVGLKRPITDAELRVSIVDGSIESLIRWRPVKVGEFAFVPAGTIHAIGAGLVLAEIQQRSDTTFRLFDYGRGRELQIASALAVARAEVAPSQAGSLRLSQARTLLLADPHFVIEHLDLPGHSAWRLFAEHETWLLGIAGEALVGEVGFTMGESLYLQEQQATLQVGASGLRALVAYVGGASDPMLLTEIDLKTETSPVARVPPLSNPGRLPPAMANTPEDAQ